MNESWFKSKLIKFMVIYWAVIIMLVYAVEWTGRHEAALTVLFTIAGISIVLFVVLRLASWWRGRNPW